MQKPSLQSDKSYKNPIIYTLGIIFSCFIGWLSYTSGEKPSDEIFAKGFGILFPLLALLCLWVWCRGKKIKFYTQYFEVEDYFGLRKRTFLYQDIEQWVCEEKSNRYTEWTQLILWLNDGTKLKFYSTDYTNFPRILRQFTAGKRENKSLKNQRERRTDRLYALFFLVLSIFFFYHFFDNKPIALSNKNVVEITGHLSEPVIIETGRKSGFTGLIFYLKEYPNYEFKISSVVSDEAMKYDLDKENILKINILKSDYNAKILQNGEGSFIDKYIFPYSIKVVGIDDYFSTLQYETKENNRRSSSKFWLLIVGFITLFVATFFAFYQTKEN